MALVTPHETRSLSAYPPVLAALGRKVHLWPDQQSLWSGLSMDGFRLLLMALPGTTGTA